MILPTKILLPCCFQENHQNCCMPEHSTRPTTYHTQQQLYCVDSSPSSSVLASSYWSNHKSPWCLGVHWFRIVILLSFGSWFGRKVSYEGKRSSSLSRYRISIGRYTAPVHLDFSTGLFTSFEPYCHTIQGGTWGLCIAGLI